MHNAEQFYLPFSRIYIVEEEPISIDSVYIQLQMVLTISDVTKLREFFCLVTLTNSLGSASDVILAAAPDAPDPVFSWM